MAKIRIIAVPTGEAPEWVRKAWVGLELPTRGVLTDTTFQVGVLGGNPDPENFNGYAVDGEVAINILSRKHPDAADWWRKFAPHILSRELVFGKKFCKLIE